jgi:hypothetical protein
MGNGLGFIVDVKIIICLPLGGNPICIPDDGFHVLKHQEIPACSKNFTDMLKSECYFTCNFVHTSATLLCASLYDWVCE